MEIRRILSVLILTFFMGTPAYGQKLCPGLSGSARTQCLNNEVEKGKKETDRINKKLNNIDSAILATCAARMGANWYVGGGWKVIPAKLSIQAAIDRAFGVSGACVGAARRKGLLP